ncbi:hypothetical protein [Halorubrum luteum]
MNRRQALIATAGSVLAAGCLGDEGGQEEQVEEEEEEEVEEVEEQPTQWGIESCETGEFTAQIFGLTEQTRVGGNALSIGIRNNLAESIEVSEVTIETTGAAGGGSWFIDDEYAFYDAGESGSIIIERSIDPDDVTNLNIRFVHADDTICY